MFSLSPLFSYFTEPKAPPVVDDAFKAAHHWEYRPTLFPNDWQIMWVDNDTGEVVTPVSR